MQMEWNSPGQGRRAEDDRFQKLEKCLLYLSFMNLFLVAVLGVLLRANFLFPIPVPYKFLLHAHSHFAFGGWIMPVLLFIILKTFPKLKNEVPFRHWRNTALLLLVSAYGMLIAFPLQGYKAVSISFSTLSILASFYLCILFLKAKAGKPLSLPEQLLKAGLIFLVLSSAGPLATGPLIALGKQGTALYYNCIYFFIHFQFNGFFTFVVLAVICSHLTRIRVAHKKLLFSSLWISCILCFFLSILWNDPSRVFHVAGGWGALLQLAAVIFILREVWIEKKFSGIVFRLSFAALLLKCLLQVLSAFPFFALFAASQRSIMIAFLHLGLMGFVTLFVFAEIKQKGYLGRGRKTAAGLVIFIGSFMLTEVMLVFQGGTGGILIPGVHKWLLGLAVLFPLSLLPILAGLNHPVKMRHAGNKTPCRLPVSREVAG